MFARCMKIAAPFGLLKDLLQGLNIDKVCQKGVGQIIQSQRKLLNWTSLFLYAFLNIHCKFLFVFLLFFFFFGGGAVDTNLMF